MTSFMAIATQQVWDRQRQGTMTANELRASFWQISLADLEQQVGSGPEGLSSREATERLARHGPNTIDQRRQYGLA